MTRQFRNWIFWLSILGFLVALLFPASGSQAAGLVDVPLKPWTYFDPYRDWTYTAIEKLVTSGLVGPQVLNTKPMSRMAMARIVALAVQKIRQDETGRFSKRTDLEPVLYELMDELAPELEALEVRSRKAAPAGQPWLTVQPMSHLQVRGFYSKADANPENSQGLKLRRHFNGTIGFDSYVELDDYVSGYIHPEFLANAESQNGKIVEGYAKLKYRNFALRFGRESIWWGPGYHGSMMFSNNAPPLDQLRIGSAEPFILPWFFKYLGPTQMELLFARLEANRDFPRTILGSWRIDSSPLPFLEVGLDRTVQMGGKGRPSMGVPSYLAALAVSSDNPGSKYQTNQLYSIDVTLRLHDVDRVVPLSRDLALYADIEVDDTCCKNVVWPLKPGYMLGLSLPNFLRRNDSEIRVEWATSSSIDFTHGTWTNGISYRGFPIAHYMGARAQDLYFRATERILPNLKLGLEFGFAKVGSAEFAQVKLPREDRAYGGFDVGYRPIDSVSMLLGYRFERTNNKNFDVDQRATNHILRLEATYSLPIFEKGVLRR
jgi:hypothetical protein